MFKSIIGSCCTEAWRIARWVPTTAFLSVLYVCMCVCVHSHISVTFSLKLSFPFMSRHCSICNDFYLCTSTWVLLSHADIYTDMMFVRLYIYSHVCLCARCVYQYKSGNGINRMNIISEVIASWGLDSSLFKLILSELL